LPPAAADLYEARLVERFRQGDANALSALFEMHVDRVYGYTRHILGNREDAEEVASEAFMRAFRRAVDYRGEAPFRHWLFGIARNLCRDRLRQPRLLTVPPDQATEEPVIDDTERRAIQSDVRTAVSALPEEYQDILILCDAEEWNAREVADLLGKSLEATKSMLYRARRALRAELNERWKDR
jgi:RNA polymerase sigma-70 factor, ECF subfamily